jgi:hypothetical protein
MTMKLENQALAVALAGALMLPGCGRQTADSPPQGADGPVAVTQTQTPAVPPETAGAAGDTNGATGGAVEFQSKALASPFADAELALKESYNRALIAYQIGDYARAVAELEDLTNTPDLTAEQQRAVQSLLAQAKKQAPAAAPTQPAAEPAKLTTPAAVDTPDAPFATADQSVKETYARALAAYKIDDFARAEAELKDLASAAGLTTMQLGAVQSLLSEVQKKAAAAAVRPAP